VAGDSDKRGGVDLGGTKIQAVVIDRGGEVAGQEKLPTPTDGGPEDVAEQLVAALRGAADEAGLDAGSLERVGIGSPGDVDAATGTVSAARNLPGWEGSFNLGGHVRDAVGIPVAIGNDVDVAVLAEVELGAALEHRSALGVWWGTGVGGGVVIERRLWHGRDAAGEIGHMVVKIDGAHCPCGRRGCLEAYAGRKAMERKAREEHEKGRHTHLFKLMHHHGRDRLTSGIWERALDHDDKLAEELIERAIEALGAGIASACNLLDPEVVILGGGLGDRLGPRYRDEIEKEMRKHLFTDDDPPAFAISKLGDLGGAIGASLLASPGEEEEA